MPMGRNKPKLLRLLRWIAVVFFILVLLVYVGLPVGAGVAAVLPAKGTVGAPPDGYETVTLTAQDGIQLQGWYRPPDNGAVIILLHGAGGTRESMRAYAAALAKHGYGILALDLRGHGESQGKTNRLGWQGTLDVGAAVTFLQGHPDVQRIGGLGSSMGGEVLLGAASTYPAIEAIVADGATRRCTEEYFALETNRSIVHSFTAQVMYLTVQLLSGTQPPSPLLDSMIEAASTRFLLIAAGQNALETAFNQHFANVLGSRADLWTVAGATHTGAFGLDLQTYEQRVTDFFQAELLDAQSTLTR